MAIGIQELDRLHSVMADEAAEDLRRGFSGRLSDAGCSVEADKLKILEEVKRSGHETLVPSMPSNHVSCSFGGGAKDPAFTGSTMCLCF